ncbi:MAG: ParB/RepB/Spo0J family partition protein [Lachnospiraceae bacterium]|nr:ParB/RepB/Spo0J family partition protein [Lachnospiraceae bacterium]
MAVKKKGLGKGLDAMIPKSIPTQADERSVAKGAAVQVPIQKVEPNRQQPRKKFDEEALAELTESVKEHGVIFPLLVQDRGDHYEIIAGERRWRAARAAGLKEVPVNIQDFSEQKIVEVSLIENIQREDLNDIEEAMAYKRLMTEFGLKQDEVAKRVGKNRSTVANSVRLLNLEQEIQNMLIEGEITSGHARALLTIDDSEKRLAIAKKIAEEKLSVRDIEKLVKNPDSLEPKKKPAPKPDVLDLIYRDWANNLTQKFSARVSINAKDATKGKIEIEYFSKEELDNLLELLASVKTEG